MSKPIGTPPTTGEIAEHTQQAFTQYRYGPVTPTKVSDSHFIFQSETYPIQFELRIKGDIDQIRYTVYEIPQPEGEQIADNTKHCDRLYNNNSWEKEISRLLMSVSGAINGAIDRYDIQPRDE